MEVIVLSIPAIFLSPFVMNVFRSFTDLKRALIMRSISPVTIETLSTLANLLIIVFAIL